MRDVLNTLGAGIRVQLVHSQEAFLVVSRLRLHVGQVLFEIASEELVIVFQYVLWLCVLCDSLPHLSRGPPLQLVVLNPYPLDYLGHGLGLVQDADLWQRCLCNLRL